MIHRLNHLKAVYIIRGKKGQKGFSKSSPSMIQKASVEWVEKHNGLCQLESILSSLYIYTHTYLVGPSPSL